MMKAYRGFKLLLSVLLVWSIVFSAIPAMTATASAAYRVFILSDPALLSEDDQAPVDIAGLKSFYEGDGHTVTLIDAAQFASATSFNAGLSDLLVLPYGPKFPLEAVDNFKKYTADGGKTITLGGYAFSRLNEPNPGYSLSVSAAAASQVQWRTVVDAASFNGRSLKLSVWMKTDQVNTSGGFAHSSVYIYDANNGLLSWSDFKKSTGTNGWDRYDNDFTVPAGAASIQINLGLYQTAGTAWFDKVLLTDASNEAVLLYDDFEEGIPARWQTLTFSGSGTFQHAADAPALLQGSNHSLSISAESKSSAQWSTSLLPWNMTPGQSYNASVWMKTSAVDVGGYAFASIYFYDAAGALLSWRDMQQKNKSTGWFRTDYTFTLPAGTARIDINLGLYGTYGEALFDKVLLARSDGSGIVYSEDFEQTGPGRNWRQMTYAGSPAYGIKGDGPILPEADNKSLSIAANQLGSFVWRKSLNASQLAGHSRFRIKAALKTEDIANADGVQGGFVHTSIYFYNGSTLLGFKDFNRIYAGTQRWENNLYEFELPAGTTAIQLDLGMYNAKGKAWFDNVLLTADDGTVLLKDTFAGGSAPGWQPLTMAGTGTLAVADGGAPIVLGADRPDTVADWLEYDSSAMPLFDEEHQLLYADSIAPAADQTVFSGSFGITGPIEGYSAITVTGNDRGRWQPLLTAKDRNGLDRGTIGAILRLFPQPDDINALDNVDEWMDYRGASIAFFGVTSHNLLAAGHTALRAGFSKLTDILVQDTYLQTLDNKWDNYRAGESPQFTASIGNGGQAAASGTVRFEVRDEDNGQLVFSQDVPYTVGAKAQTAVTATWSSPSFADDFYEVKAILKNGSGDAIDQIGNGFSVWDQDVVDAGPQMVYEDNYLSIVRPDQSRKTVFATGTDDGANLMLAMDQTALQWKMDMQQHVDAGLTIYENLQQYPSWPVWAAIFSDPVRKEKYLRKVDHIVYLSQKYKQIYKMGLAIGNDVGVTDAELEETADFIQEMADRYKDVPGLMYYLNGDMRSTLTSKVLPLWRSFLQTKYGTVANLNTAWGSAYASFGDVPIEPNYPVSGIDPNDSNGYGLWEDHKAYDYNTFKTTLTTRWTGRLIEAVQDGDPTYENNPILTEFYRFPAYGFDISTSLGDLTYSNVGNFEMHYTFPEQMQYADSRAVGQGFGVGEYGKRTHPLFSYMDGYSSITSTTPEEARNNFFGYMNMGFAMGTNHMQTWSWTDESKYVFPWGMRYTGDKVGRSLLYWFRNSSLFTRQMEPVYEQPQVAVLQPDRSRLSGGTFGIAAHTASVNAFDILQSAHVTQLLTLNEHVLAQDPNTPIDPAIKVIFYPVPYNPDDVVYNKLKAWVQNGGVLYLSGDISYDENRQRTKGQRLADLAGASAVNQVYYNGLNWHKAPYAARYYEYNPAAGDSGRSTMTAYAVKPNLDVTFNGNVTALYKDEHDKPVVAQHPLGAGKVVYSTVPLELFYNPGIGNTDPATLDHDVRLYRKVLGLANIDTTGVLSPDQSRVKVFELPLRDQSGKVYTVASVDPASGYNGTVFGRYYNELGAGYSHMIWEDGDANLKGVFNRGVFKDNGATLIENGAYAHVFAKDAAKLVDSKQVVVLPQQAGSMKLKNTATWANRKVVAGQVENGQWIETDAIHASFTGGYIEFEVGGEQSSKIILIVEESEKQAVIAAVVQDLTDLNA